MATSQRFLKRLSTNGLSGQTALILTLAAILHQNELAAILHENAILRLASTWMYLQIPSFARNLRFDVLLGPGGVPNKTSNPHAYFMASEASFMKYKS